MKPFEFIPQLKSVLWGGEQIAEYKGIETTCQLIGESWELSGLPGKESVVATGSDRGLTLPALIAKYKGALVGEKIYDTYGCDFPLLVKIIDAKRDLSLQVHPSERYARQRHNCHGKNEMWYILRAEAGAQILSGFARNVSLDEYDRLVDTHSILNVVASHDSHKGDVFYLPAGRIHSIGAGNLLVEIQQSSDVTYRIYDYDRVDASGNKRELHTQQARDVIDLCTHDDYRTLYDRQAIGITTVVKSDDFMVYKAVVQGALSFSTSALDSFAIVFCIDGSATVGTGSDATIITQGHTLLIPAMWNTIELAGNASLLITTMH